MQGRVKEATGIEKDEKMMAILIDATTSELESFNNHLLMYAPNQSEMRSAMLFIDACEIRGEKKCTQKLLVIGPQGL
ncbi:hypothetical protein DPMN_176491 [Dreissena polymorpha]|uniref:Uncharacterized protein n=1 Tax=Dreissena polymorpha TaxID=45954 RepID=A0A9D4EA05_DREPO|nr:hypothetical protein DPMN_176491 [Dreissena polymorpha]